MSPALLMGRLSGDNSLPKFFDGLFLVDGFLGVSSMSVFVPPKSFRFFFGFASSSLPDAVRSLPSFADSFEEGGERGIR